MKFLFEVYFAFRNHKLLHYERYYIVTYDIVNRQFCIWYVDGFYKMNLLSSCEDKARLEFTWEILMNRRNTEYATD